MSHPTRTVAALAHDVHGAGTPVVLLHGLTFDRRTWRPIVDRLDGSVCSIAVDLPAHGESGGAPAPLEQVATQLHALLTALEVERPVVVGHSLSASLACVYALTYPTRGLVCVEGGLHVEPFAELAQRLEPVLRGPGFAEAWQTFERSLGLERIPEPERSLVLEAHDVRQDVVLGYWDTLLRTDPAELQAWIDAQVERLDVPSLAVYGRPLSEGERERFERLGAFRSEEWLDHGHLVHLVDPDRFTTRLRAFVEQCTAGRCVEIEPVSPTARRRTGAAGAPPPPRHVAAGSPPARRP